MLGGFHCERTPEPRQTYSTIKNSRNVRVSPSRDLQDRFDAFALNDIQQRERRPGRLLCPPLQLRDISDREVQVAGEHRLAHLRAGAQRSNLRGGERRDLGRILWTQMPQWNLVLGVPVE